MYEVDTPEETVFWEMIREAHKFKGAEKEGPTMQVSYNGFAGELVKLEKMDTLLLQPYVQRDIYNLSIYDSEKNVTHSFAGVKLEDVKFLGGEVSFV